MKGPESLGIFHAMMWEAETMMQVQMPKFVKIISDLSELIYFLSKKISCGWGFTADPIVTTVCLYI